MYYVTSDIHGNYEAYQSIMRQIKLSDDDHLYVLGDCIDRYPDGLRILFELCNMSNVTVFMGNHEYMMKEVLNGAIPGAWFGNGGKVTYESYKSLNRDDKESLKHILATLPVDKVVEVNGVKYMLCHSHPLGKSKNLAFVDPVEAAVWKRVDMYSHPAPEYHLIFGHTPTDHYQSEYPLKIWRGEGMTGIDCRAYSPMYGGRLACLRLDDMTEFYSE